MTESKNLKNDELLSMMEEMQDEIESLRLENGSLHTQLDQEISKKNGKDSEAQRTISDLSSAVSMLKKKVQEQTQEIVDLNGLIAKLESSDLQLNIAEKMKEQAEEKLNMASTLASDTKALQAELDNREIEIHNEESRLSKLRNNIESEIKERVNHKASLIEDNLEKEYRKKRQELKDKCQNTKAMFMGSFISMTSFTVLATIITALTSKPFKSALASFSESLGDKIESLAMRQEENGKIIAGDFFGIQSTEKSFEVVTGIMIVIQIIIVLAIIILIGIFLFKNIKEYLMDEVSVVVIIVAIASTVYGAPALIKLPINMFTTEVAGILLYMSIRFFIEWDKQAVKTWILFWGLWIPFSILLICAMASVGK